MKSVFKATVVLSLEQHTNDTIPSHISTSVGLSPSSNLEESMYIDENSLLTEDGNRVLSTVLAHGIVANILQSEQRFLWEREEHLDYILEEIREGLTKKTKNIIKDK